MLGSSKALTKAAEAREADRIVSVRPNLNIRREALSYVAQHCWYILQGERRGYFTSRNKNEELNCSDVQSQLINEKRKKKKIFDGSSLSRGWHHFSTSEDIIVNLIKIYIRIYIYIKFI